jgi:hypothetical protein
MALVIVDAENVRRSVWPNLPPEELVARAREWAASEGHNLLVVFDGPPPVDAGDLVGAAHADDEIVGLASSAEEDVWAVTSDRALRARVAPHVKRVLGGGSFARTLARQDN